MSHDTLYFLVTKGGKSDAIVTEIKAKLKTAWESWRAFVKAHGTTKMYASKKLYALEFETVPDGWKKAPKKANYGGYVPDPKTEKGRAIKAEMDALPTAPDNMAFSSTLGLHFVVQGNRVRFAGFENIGDDVVITIPDMSEMTDADAPCAETEENNPKKAAQFIPPDCRQLKNSEYYALLEAHEEKTVRSGKGKSS